MAEDSAGAERLSNASFEYIPCKSISISPFHPRVDPGNGGLSESIDAVGQLYPILVVADGDRYSLLDGRQRLRILRDQYGDDFTIEAKVYPASLPLASRARMVHELHDLDDFATHIAYAGRVRTTIEPSLDAQSERDVAVTLGMTTGRDKTAFLYAPIVTRLRNESQLREYLADSQTPVTQIRAGDRRAITLQKYWSFLSSFINTRLVSDEPNHRDAERAHVVRLSDLLVENLLAPLWTRSSDPPHQALVDCTRHHPLTALGQVIGEDGSISDAPDAPLYTRDESDIDWERLAELFTRATDVPWGDESIREERSLKRLRRELRGHLYK